MMRVRIEIVPGGREAGRRVIEELFVWNVSALADVSDYGYQFNSDPREVGTLDARYVRNHERSDGAWELVRRILTQEDLVEWGPGDH